MNASENPNIVWARIFVEELTRQGLRHVCITPGSRSTPLALAFAAAETVTVYSHVDERSAAFFALGMARELGQPIGLLCTSGTAVANFLPAVIEANHSEIPLIVLTADRPYELRDSGSNQTIDQVNIYGRNVRWSVDIAPPAPNPSLKMMRSLRSLAGRAWAAAQGLKPGPVHLNFQFRKPLEPADHFVLTPDREIGTKAAVDIRMGKLLPSRQQIDVLTEAIAASSRGLIVCGPACPQDDFAQVVTELGRVTGYPILADALSGVRFGSHVREDEQLIFGGYESYLASAAAAEWPEPELVLRFGAMPTSKALMDYLGRISLSRQIQITRSGAWKDDAFVTTDLVQAEPEAVCRALLNALQQMALPARENFMADNFRSAEENSWVLLDEMSQTETFEGRVVLDILDQLPNDSYLHVASSLPVRHLDQFARPNPKAVQASANRGASGIDGTISTGLGIAAASGKHIVILTGDLALYHDMNALIGLQRFGLTATVVVINNDGGGIFHRLPIAKFEPPFTELFVTPHGLNFEPLAEMFSMQYVRADDRKSFQETFRISVAESQPCLIEVPSDASKEELFRQRFLQMVSERISINVPETA